MSVLHNFFTKVNPFSKKTFLPGIQNGAYTHSLMFQQAFSRYRVDIGEYFELYQQIMPLQNAIDKIGDKMATIEIILKDKSNKLIFDHPFLDFLKRPNLEQSQSELMENLAKDFAIAGNAFLILTLSYDGKPLELFVEHPSRFGWNLEPDGIVERYYETYDPSENSFYRRTFLNGAFQYLNQTGQKRLFHIKAYNPNVVRRKSFGLSRMHGMLYELLLYRAGMTHNLSLLSQGARPSMLLKVKDSIAASPDQMQQLTATIQNFISGTSNAGRVLTSNEIESIENYMVNNLDMDYVKLEDAVYKKIYQGYHVPLPLITNEASTFNNYSTAQKALIKDAVLPFFQRFADYFTINLLPYFNLSRDLKVTYFKFAIDTLREESVDEVKQKQPLGIMSDNELRVEIGLPHIDSVEADEIYKPSNSLMSYTIEEGDNNAT